MSGLEGPVLLFLSRKMLQKDFNISIATTEASLQLDSITYKAVKSPGSGAHVKSLVFGRLEYKFW